MEPRKLPQEVISKLRSGFSISSVTQSVTELVLNSLDAKSKNIAVRINLQTFRIQVVDDGDGITEDNLQWIGTRYMTSKLQTLNDFQKISKYYGYKGESLASIKEHAKRIIITTKCYGSETFSKTLDGDIVLIKDRPSQGTTVTIEDFLYNLPVRRNVVNADLELNSIRSNLEAISIIHPTVSFTLRNDMNRKLIFSSVKCDSVELSLINIYPRLKSENFGALKLTSKVMSVIGLIYKELVEFKAQHVYVNKLPVESNALHRLITDELMNSTIYTKQKNNYFCYLLNIKCPNSNVDFCVCGSKTFAEFKEWNAVVNFVHKFMTKFLKREGLELPMKKLEVIERKVPSLRDIRLSAMGGACKSKIIKRCSQNSIKDIKKSAKKRKQYSVYKEEKVTFNARLKHRKLARQLILSASKIDKDVFKKLFSKDETKIKHNRFEYEKSSQEIVEDSIQDVFLDNKDKEKTFVTLKSVDTFWNINNQKIGKAMVMDKFLKSVACTGVEEEVCEEVAASVSIKISRKTIGKFKPSLISTMSFTQTINMKSNCGDDSRPIGGSDGGFEKFDEEFDFVEDFQLDPNFTKPILKKSEQQFNTVLKPVLKKTENSYGNKLDYFELPEGRNRDGLDLQLQNHNNLFGCDDVDNYDHKAFNKTIFDNDDGLNYRNLKDNGAFFSKGIENDRFKGNNFGYDDGHNLKDNLSKQNGLFISKSSGIDRFKGNVHNNQKSCFTFEDTDFTLNTRYLNFENDDDCVRNFREERNDVERYGFIHEKERGNNFVHGVGRCEETENNFMHKFGEDKLSVGKCGFVQENRGENFVCEFEKGRRDFINGGGRRNNFERKFSEKGGGSVERNGFVQEEGMGNDRVHNFEEAKRFEKYAFIQEENRDNFVNPVGCVRQNNQNYYEDLDQNKDIELMIKHSIENPKCNKRDNYLSVVRNYKSHHMNFERKFKEKGGGSVERNGFAQEEEMGNDRVHNFEEAKRFGKYAFVQEENRGDNFVDPIGCVRQNNQNYYEDLDQHKDIQLMRKHSIENPKCNIRDNHLNVVGNDKSRYNPFINEGQEGFVRKMFFPIRKMRGFEDEDDKCKTFKMPVFENQDDLRDCNNKDGDRRCIHSGFEGQENLKGYESKGDFYRKFREQENVEDCRQENVKGYESKGDFYRKFKAKENVEDCTNYQGLKGCKLPGFKDLENLGNDKTKGINRINFESYKIGVFDEQDNLKDSTTNYKDFKMRGFKDQALRRYIKPGFEEQENLKDYERKGFNYKDFCRKFKEQEEVENCPRYQGFKMLGFKGQEILENVETNGMNQLNPKGCKINGFGEQNLENCRKYQGYRPCKMRDSKDQKHLSDYEAKEVFNQNKNCSHYASKDQKHLAGCEAKEVFNQNKSCFHYASKDQKHLADCEAKEVFNQNESCPYYQGFKTSKMLGFKGQENLKIGETKGINIFKPKSCKIDGFDEHDNLGNCSKYQGYIACQMRAFKDQKNLADCEAKEVYHQNFHEVFNRQENVENCAKYQSLKACKTRGFEDQANLESCETKGINYLNFKTKMRIFDEQNNPEDQGFRDRKMRDFKDQKSIDDFESKEMNNLNFRSYKRGAFHKQENSEEAFKPCKKPGFKNQEHLEDCENKLDLQSGKIFNENLQVCTDYQGFRGGFKDRDYLQDCKNNRKNYQDFPLIFDKQEKLEVRRGEDGDYQGFKSSKMRGFEGQENLYDCKSKGINYNCFDAQNNGHNRFNNCIIPVESVDKLKANVFSKRVRSCEEFTSNDRNENEFLKRKDLEEFKDNRAILKDIPQYFKRYRSEDCYESMNNIAGDNFRDLQNFKRLKIRNENQKQLLENAKDLSHLEVIHQNNVFGSVGSDDLQMMCNARKDFQPGENVSKCLKSKVTKLSNKKGMMDHKKIDNVNMMRLEKRLSTIEEIDHEIFDKANMMDLEKPRLTSEEIGNTFFDDAKLIHPEKRRPKSEEDDHNIFADDNLMNNNNANLMQLKKRQPLREEIGHEILDDANMLLLEKGRPMNEEIGNTYFGDAELMHLEKRRTISEEIDHKIFDRANLMNLNKRRSISEEIDNKIIDCANLMNLNKIRPITEETDHKIFDCVNLMNLNKRRPISGDIENQIFDNTNEKLRTVNKKIEAEKYNPTNLLCNNFGLESKRNNDNLRTLENSRKQTNLIPRNHFINPLKDESFSLEITKDNLKSIPKKLKYQDRNRLGRKQNERSMCRYKAFNRKHRNSSRNSNSQGSKSDEKRNQHGRVKRLKFGGNDSSKIFRNYMMLRCESKVTQTGKSLKSQERAAERRRRKDIFTQTSEVKFNQGAKIIDQSVSKIKDDEESEVKVKNKVHILANVIVKQGINDYPKKIFKKLDENPKEGKVSTSNEVRYFKDGEAKAASENVKFRRRKNVKKDNSHFEDCGLDCVQFNYNKNDLKTLKDLNDYAKNVDECRKMLIRKENPPKYDTLEDNTKNKLCGTKDSESQQILINSDDEKQSPLPKIVNECRKISIGEENINPSKYDTYEDHSNNNTLYLAKDSECQKISIDFNTLEDQSAHAKESPLPKHVDECRKTAINKESINPSECKTLEGHSNHKNTLIKEENQHQKVLNDNMPKIEDNIKAKSNKEDSKHSCQENKQYNTITDLNKTGNDDEDVKDKTSTSLKNFEDNQNFSMLNDFLKHPNNKRINAEIENILEKNVNDLVTPSSSLLFNSDEFLLKENVFTPEIRNEFIKPTSCSSKPQVLTSLFNFCSPKPEELTSQDVKFNISINFEELFPSNRSKSRNNLNFSFERPSFSQCSTNELKNFTLVLDSDLLENNVNGINLKDLTSKIDSTECFKEIKRDDSDVKGRNNCVEDSATIKGSEYTGINKPITRRTYTSENIKTDKSSGDIIISLSQEEKRIMLLREYKINKEKGRNDCSEGDDVKTLSSEGRCGVYFNLFNTEDKSKTSQHNDRDLIEEFKHFNTLKVPLTKLKSSDVDKLIIEDSVNCKESKIYEKYNNLEETKFGLTNDLGSENFINKDFVNSKIEESKILELKTLNELTGVLGENENSSLKRCVDEGFTEDFNHEKCTSKKLREEILKRSKFEIDESIKYKISEDCKLKLGNEDESKGSKLDNGDIKISYFDEEVNSDGNIRVKIESENHAENINQSAVNNANINCTTHADYHTGNIQSAQINSVETRSTTSNNNTGYPESDWWRRRDVTGRTFFIHKRTGMATYDNVVNENGQFTMAKRSEFVPKGQSPILMMEEPTSVSLTSSGKVKLYNALADSYKEELGVIKWNKIMHNKDPRKYFDEIYKHLPKKSPLPIISLKDNKLVIRKSCHFKQEEVVFSKDIFDEVRVIGQLDKKFIVTVSQNSTLILFDQHAVHERIRVEKLFKEYTTKVLGKDGKGHFRYKCTKLKNKLTFERSEEEVVILKKYNQFFHRLGLWYTINKNEVALSSVPTCFYNKVQREKSSEKLKGLVMALIEEEVDVIKDTNGIPTTVPKIIQNVVNSEACRGSVMFGDALDLDKCTELITKLKDCNLPFQCAHGRPTLAPIMNMTLPEGKATKLNLGKLIS